MRTASPSDPNARYVPPDPGGRSRILLRVIVVACIVGAVIAVVMMFLLHQTPPPPTPKQRPQDNSSLHLPAGMLRQA